MVHEFFMLSGAMFWIVTGLVLCLLMWEVSREGWVGLGFILTLYITIMMVFGPMKNLSTINPLTGILCTLGYIVVGVLWAVMKWYLVLKQAVRSIEQKKTEFYTINSDDSKRKRMVVTEWNDYKKLYVQKTYPQLGSSKGRIIGWMCFWPFSVIWTLLRDPWEVLYSWMRGVMRSISDSVAEKAGIYKEDEDVPGGDQ